jgi:hypothetical protein
MAISIIVLLHVLFFVLALNYRHIYTLDSPEYLRTASNISTHCISYNGVLTNPLNPGFYSLRPPGYALFILFCKAVFSSDFTILIIQNLISILLLCFIYLKLQQTDSIKKHSWLFLCGLIFFPIYLILINMVLADGLLAFLLVSSWLFLERFVVSRKWFYLLLFNITLSCAAMTKPVMMYFWVPNLLFSGYLYWKTKKMYPVYMAMILILTIGAWSYRNYIKTGYFHYSSIKMQNLLELNAGAVMSHIYNHDSMTEHRRVTLIKADSIPLYKDKSQFLLNEAKQIIIRHPFLYGIIHLKGMFNFLISPGRVDIETFFGLSNDNPVSLRYEIEKKGLFHGLNSFLGKVNFTLIIFVFLIAMWNAFCLLLLIAALFSKKIEIVQRIFLFVLIFYIVFACGPGGYARFKTSIYPFILYLLPFGYQVISFEIKKRWNSIKVNKQAK